MRYLHPALPKIQKVLSALPDEERTKCAAQIARTYLTRAQIAEIKKEFDAAARALKAFQAKHKQA